VRRRRAGAADLDEAGAAASAAALGVAFVRDELPTALARGNLEARARSARYAALRRMAAAHDCGKIATGHTLDDQAETVLMRLLRGSGGRGLGAIRPRRADGIIRPLIECRRGDVEAVVRAAGLAYRIDQSNCDPRFLRTQVRERVLPLLGELNPSIARACANLAAAARAERGIVAAWADAQLAGAMVDGRLATAWLRQIPPPLRPLLVRRWLMRAGLAGCGLTARHALGVLQLIENRRGRAEIHLPGGWTARRNGPHLLVDRHPSPGRRLARSSPQAV
jgi:tRNA(Ile)-lysidine synthase